MYSLNLLRLYVKCDLGQRHVVHLFRLSKSPMTFVFRLSLERVLHLTDDVSARSKERAENLLPLRRQERQIVQRRTEQMAGGALAFAALGAVLLPMGIVTMLPANA